MWAPKHFCVYLIIAIFTVFAQAAETSIELGDGTVVTNVRTIEKKLSVSELTFQGLIVGTSSLADVKKKFGNADMYSEGEASKHVNVICYKGAKGNIAAFESSGEMGGKGYTVTNIVLALAGSSYRFKSHCKQKASISLKTEIGGLALGMKVSDVEKVMGQPSKELTNLIIYNYHSSKNTPGGIASLNSIIELNFSDQRLSKLSISHIESY